MKYIILSLLLSTSVNARTKGPLFLDDLKKSPKYAALKTLCDEQRELYWKAEENNGKFGMDESLERQANAIEDRAVFLSGTNNPEFCR